MCVSSLYECAACILRDTATGWPTGRASSSCAGVWSWPSSSGVNARPCSCGARRERVNSPVPCRHALIPSSQPYTLHPTPSALTLEPSILNPKPALCRHVLLRAPRAPLHSPPTRCPNRKAHGTRSKPHAQERQYACMDKTHAWTREAARMHAAHAHAKPSRGRGGRR